MTVRMFTDANGDPWQVWAVHPALPDRRSGGDRRAGMRRDPAQERRRGPDRRIRDIGRPPAVAGALADGWLCFQPAHDDGALRRRLAPVPTGWEQSPESALRALLAQAVVAARARRSA